MIVRNYSWAKELVEIKNKDEEVVNKVWPGKVTLVLHKKDIVPGALTADFNSVGIRIPDFMFTDELLAKFGYPITSTSANISGQESTNDINKIIEIFSKSTLKPDLVIDAGILPKSEPSMIIDLTGNKPKVLRISPTRPEKLLELLELGSK